MTRHLLLAWHPPAAAVTAAIAGAASPARVERPTPEAAPAVVQHLPTDAPRPVVVDLPLDADPHTLTSRTSLRALRAAANRDDVHLVVCRAEPATLLELAHRRAVLAGSTSTCDELARTELTADVLGAWTVELEEILRGAPVATTSGTTAPELDALAAELGVRSPWAAVAPQPEVALGDLGTEVLRRMQVHARSPFEQQLMRRFCLTTFAERTLHDGSTTAPSAG